MTKQRDMLFCLKTSFLLFSDSLLSGIIKSSHIVSKQESIENWKPWYFRKHDDHGLINKPCQCGQYPHKLIDQWSIPSGFVGFFVPNHQAWQPGSDAYQQPGERIGAKKGVFFCWENTGPLEEENHLPNHLFQVQHVNLQGCTRHTKSYKQQLCFGRWSYSFGWIFANFQGRNVGF